MSLYLGSNLISGVFTTHHTTTYDTADATAKEGDILSGKTAYVNGSKITGTIPSKTGSDVTVSGASFTVPAGYYASAYTGTIASGTLRTPTYTTTTSTGAVTITYGVSAAGYLAVSSPTWTFTPFTKRSSVAQTVTPSTTTAKTVTVPAGYYPTAETITISKATGGSQVQTGTVSASSKVYTISTSFTPKGVMMISTSTYDFDGAENLMSIWAFNSATTASGWYEVAEEVSPDEYMAITSDLFGSGYLDPADSTASDYEDVTVIIPGTYTSANYASVLDDYLYNPASYYTADSTLNLGELGWSLYAYQMGGGSQVTAYAVSGCTVSYSSTGVTIDISGGGYYCPSMTYVVWG